MRLNDITIRNFRGFDEKQFSFDPKVNVVLGNNTTGKTTLLHGIQIALGAFLQELTLVSGCARNAKESDTVRRYSELTKSFHKQAEKPSFGVRATVTEGVFDFASLKYTATEKEIKWLRSGIKNSRKNAGELMDAVEQMEQGRRSADETKTTTIMPIMLAFGASRLDDNYNGAEKSRARAAREPRAKRRHTDTHWTRKWTSAAPSTGYTDLTKRWPKSGSLKARTRPSSMP